jgi:hypothetical protein
MHSFHISILSLVVVLVVLSCNVSGKQDKLSSIGLIESFIGRSEVHQAMDIVNQFIKEKKLSEIKCGWESKEFNNNELYYFLTQPDGLPFNTVAQVSKENMSVFISSSWRSICNSLFKLSEEDSTLRMHALVFVLLHEVGHLIGKENYIAIQSSNIKLDSLFLRNKMDMKEELFADFFAANIVKSSQLKISQELRKNIDELYSRVSFYFNSRYGIHGGGLRMMLAEPAKEFGDLNYSHPNLNLRMHLISYLINPTSEKLEILQWVQEKRKLYSDIDTFTPDVMDGLIHLKNLPDTGIIQIDTLK